jgi:predicted KAP-like P-loop ATPase
VAAAADPPQGQRLAAFLSDLPSAQIKPSIVPKIGDQAWANDLFDKWEKSPGVSAPVKKAIKQRRDDGNVRVQ